MSPKVQRHQIHVARNLSIKIKFDPVPDDVVVQLLSPRFPSSIIPYSPCLLRVHICREEIYAPHPPRVVHGALRLLEMPAC